MTCSDEAWRALWVGFDKTTADTYRVERADLEDVLKCHRSTPAGLIVREPRDGSRSVEVRRSVMWIFLTEHGVKHA